MPDGPLTLDQLIAGFDEVYNGLKSSPTAVRAEGISKLYRVVKIMFDTLQTERAEALFDFLEGLYVDEVRQWNTAMADIPGHTIEEPADLLEDDGEGWMAWHNQVRALSYRPTSWTVRLGRRTYECFSSPHEVFTIAARARRWRMRRRQQPRAHAAARAAGAITTGEGK